MRFLLLTLNLILNENLIGYNRNIAVFNTQPSSKIYIFDRFGKLIKQISSTSDGWDGTFNGQMMPSTDYWFTVDFIEQGKSRQFKAHFSLKR